MLTPAYDTCMLGAWLGDAHCVNGLTTKYRLFTWTYVPCRNTAFGAQHTFSCAAPAHARLSQRGRKQIGHFER